MKCLFYFQFKLNYLCLEVDCPLLYNWIILDQLEQLSWCVLWSFVLCLILLCYIYIFFLFLREGLSVVKVFAIRDPSLPLKTHREKLDGNFFFFQIFYMIFQTFNHYYTYFVFPFLAIKGLLKKVPNTIPFQKTMVRTMWI